MLIKNLFLLFICSLILLFTSCEQPGGGTKEPEFTIVKQDIDLTGYGTNQDVYFIFTNATTSTAPVVPSFFSETDGRSLNGNDSTHTNIKRVINEVDAEIRSQYDIVYNLQSNPPKLDINISRAASYSYSWVAPLDSDTFESESEENFYVVNQNGYDIVPSICKKVITDGTITLSIYVDNANVGIITDTMVTTIADKFLKASSDLDIYKWVTDLYGEPWGARNYSNVLPSEAKNHITILLTDLFTDGSDNGGVVGLYDSAHNYYNSTNYPVGSSISNERLMFFIDSLMYANAKNYDGIDDSKDTQWLETDFWPQEVFSTLTHEFQHMIHYYNKRIIHERSSYSDTWFNEMCSVVTEDLTSSYQQVEGPRGHLGAYGGTTDITSGRLPLFNYFNDESITSWSDNADYESVYAFGAFLARNYGGASLFKEMVNSSLINEQAIISAIFSVSGKTRTFEELLIEWGKSVLLSDLPDVVSEVGYNKSETNLGYDIYPINLNNYTYNFRDELGNLTGESISQPWIYTNTNQMVKQPPASNYYFLVGTDIPPGSYYSNVELPKGTTITVVTRDSP